MAVKRLKFKVGDIVSRRWGTEVFYIVDSIEHVAPGYVRYHCKVLADKRPQNYREIYGPPAPVISQEARYLNIARPDVIEDPKIMFPYMIIQGTFGA